MRRRRGVGPRPPSGRTTRGLHRGRASTALQAIKAARGRCRARPCLPASRQARAVAGADLTRGEASARARLPRLRDATGSARCCARGVPGTSRHCLAGRALRPWAAATAGRPACRLTWCRCTAAPDALGHLLVAIPRPACREAAAILPRDGPQGPWAQAPSAALRHRRPCGHHRRRAWAGRRAWARAGRLPGRTGARGCRLEGRVLLVSWGRAPAQGRDPASDRARSSTARVAATRAICAASHTCSWRARGGAWAGAAGQVVGALAAGRCPAVAGSAAEPFEFRGWAGGCRACSTKVAVVPAAALEFRSP
jgi:hypothetical protein